MKHIVVQDIKSETKVGKSVYLFDFFFLVTYGAVSFLFGSTVHEMLRIPFYIFSAVCAIFLTMKSNWNKKRRNWESLLLYIRRDKGVYYPLVNENVATELDKKRRKEAVGYVLGRHYDGKVKYLVNDLLMNLRGLAPLCIPNRLH